MLVEPSKTTGRADAEMLEIVQHLLLSSPPGEFDEVWYDAQILVPKLISPQILAGIARAYNHENLSVAIYLDRNWELVYVLDFFPHPSPVAGLDF